MEEGRGINEENVALNGNLEGVFEKLAREDGTRVLSTLCNDPLLNVYARTQACKKLQTPKI